MYQLPTYQRSPRIKPELPQGEITIPAPPQAPTAPTISPVAILLPGLMAVVGLGVTIFSLFNQSALGSSNSSLMRLIPLASFGFMAVNASTAGFNFMTQKGKYKRNVREREEKYRALLKSRAHELAALREKQQSVLRQTDPDPQTLLGRTERLNRRLWERSPGDSDFLSTRLGLGTFPSTVVVKPPKQEDTLQDDPLVQEAQTLSNEYAQVPEVPIPLPLFDAGVAGLAGPRDAVLNTVRTIAMQIATNHSPDEVKICAIFPPDEVGEWNFLRWLPHVWTDDHNHRFLAHDKGTAHQLLISLYDLLNRRRMQTEASHNPNLLPPLPYFVFFLAYPELIQDEPIYSLLLTRGKQVGAFSIMTAGLIDYLPKECKAIAESGGTGQAELIQTAPTRLRITYVPDDLAAGLAERMARAMAPIQLQSVSQGEIPDVVPLLDLLGANTVDGLDVLSRWRSGESHNTMAAPIGRRAGGEPLYLDLQSHGPHGLVAGTTGSGKSELLQSVIASLAVNFHPHQVSFVIMDFKGGGMSNAFLELPHLVGTITNLQGNLAARALAALKSEIKRRERLLGTDSIDRYQRRYLEQLRNATEVGSRVRGVGGASITTPLTLLPTLEPLPHLIIIADEFAELAMDQPEFMKELISAVRVGRSLGVHVILATQKPAGVVNDQIWSNARFRICLRVEHSQDSQEVLKRPDASTLTQAGSAYFQVGNNEIFELFQSAYAGAPYEPGGIAGSGDGQEEIVELALDGSRRPLRLSPKPLVIQAETNQLQAIVNHLHEVAQKEGVYRLPGPWLPPLPERVALDELRETDDGRRTTDHNSYHPSSVVHRPSSGGWDGYGWLPTHKWIEPIVGLVDDPVRQYQGPLTLNLGKEGHLLIYGAPGTGKTTLLRTLVTSLALEHSPEDLNMYLLDFGGRLLTSFAELPHVGGVVLADEKERVQRLLASLLKVIDARKRVFARAGVSTLAAYREVGSREEGNPVGAHGRAPLPTLTLLPTSAFPIPDTRAIVVVLDNYSGFMSNYPELEEQLAEIAREGGLLGIHLAMTANGPSFVKSRVSSNFTLAVALQLAEKSDYTTVMGRFGSIEPAPVAGRGLVKGNPPLEFQTALPTDADSEYGRTTALRELVSQMASAWQRQTKDDSQGIPSPIVLRPSSFGAAPPIPMLPQIVPLCELVPPGSDVWGMTFDDEDLVVPLGLDVDTLEPVLVDLSDGPHFLVAGPVQSGKTTLLQAWMLALSEHFNPSQLNLYLIDFRRSGLSQLQRLPQVKAYIDEDSKLKSAFAEIGQELRNRKQALELAQRDAEERNLSVDKRFFLSQFPALVVAIDDYDALRDIAPAETKEFALNQLRERGLGLHVIVTGSSTDLGSNWEELPKQIKAVRTGFALSNDQSDLQVLNLSTRMLVGNESSMPLPPGQGYYGRTGRMRRIRTATAQAGDLRVRDWVALIAQRRG